MPRRGQQRVVVQGHVRRGGGGRHQVINYLQYLQWLQNTIYIIHKKIFPLSLCRWQDYNPHLAARFMGEATIQDNWEGYNGADLTKSVSSRAVK